MSNAVSDNPERSRYELAIAGDIAFIAYQRLGALRVLMHAEVPPLLRGAASPPSSPPEPWSWCARRAAVLRHAVPMWRNSSRAIRNSRTCWQSLRRLRLHRPPVPRPADR
jgi:hypothetical protein